MSIVKRQQVKNIKNAFKSANRQQLSFTAVSFTKGQTPLTLYSLMINTFLYTEHFPLTNISYTHTWVDIQCKTILTILIICQQDKKLSITKLGLKPVLTAHYKS